MKLEIPAKIVFAGLVVALLSTACGAKATPTKPTLDANALSTIAAATVIAQMTASAPKPPTPTIPKPPTQVIKPPAGTPGTPGALSTALPTIAAAVSTLPVVVIGATQPAAASPDKAAWVSQSPPDGSQIGKGVKFGIRWKVKNTGTTTWSSTNYTYRYFGGATLSETQTYLMPKNVKPGEIVELVVNATSPTVAGTYSAIWVLTNAAAKNFYTVYIEIKVP